MHTRLSITSAALIPLLLSAASGLCAESVLPETGVTIKADSMSHNQADDIITASGDVFITWQGTTLMAIKAEYKRQSQIIVASGNVVLMKDGDIVRGSRLTFDTSSGRGEIEDSNIYIRQGSIKHVDKKVLKTGDPDEQAGYTYHLAGKKFVRLNANEYSAEQGSYTTCDEENPSWKFGASELDLTVDEYGTGKNAVFYIKDVPVFYFPYFIFPGKRERQSGFLYPGLGWSKTKGAEVDLIYYWAISPSQDATVNLDIQSRRGVGGGLDYRYLRSQGSTGNLGGYLIYDRFANNLRGFMAQSHRETFSPDMNLRTSINLTTDREFLRDYGEKTGDYNRQSNDTTVNFLKTWQNYALTGNLRYTQDYYADNNRSTLQTLPEVGLAAVRQQLFSTPVYFDLDSRASNFYREYGTRGQRLYAFPRLTLVGGLPGYLNASAYAGAHLRAYSTENIASDSPVKSSDGSLIPELGVRLSTSFSRVHEVDGESLKKIRHEIIPEISYTLSASQDQSRFPLYDFSDRIPYHNIVYYSLTSLLGGKFKLGETSEYRDLMRLSLKQGYSISGGRRDLLTLADDNHPLTDLMLESDTWIHPMMRLTFDARYNGHDGYISSAAPGLAFNDKRGNIAGMSYHTTRNEVDYLEGHLSTNMLKPWIFSYAARYSFDKGDFLESVYAVEYRHQCWSIMTAYRDRPSGQSFTVNFSLMGTFGTGMKPGGLQGW